MAYISYPESCSSLYMCRDSTSQCKRHPCHASGKIWSLRYTDCWALFDWMPLLSLSGCTFIDLCYCLCSHLDRHISYSRVSYFDSRQHHIRFGTSLDWTTLLPSPSRISVACRCWRATLAWQSLLCEICTLCFYVCCLFWSKTTVYSSWSRNLALISVHIHFYPAVLLFWGFQTRTLIQTAIRHLHQPNCWMLDIYSYYT